MISIHLKDTRNIGDEVCSPALYFDGFSGRYSHKKYPTEQATVIGGGCMSRFAESFKSDAIKILWGVGATKSGSTSPPVHPEYNGFDLIGVRDYPAKPDHEWVPCPSCMSPLFDNPPEPKTQIVRYGHAKLSPMRGMNNNNMDFESVINYLASGEEVITSSYHGMIWATWLGRKVTVKPFGAKFYGWPYEWGKIHDNSLKEARKLNQDFYKKVLDLIQ